MDRIINKNMITDQLVKSLKELSDLHAEGVIADTMIAKHCIDILHRYGEFGIPNGYTPQSFVKKILNESGFAASW